VKFLYQKGSKSLFDFFGLHFGSGKSQAEIICIPTKPEPSVVGVVYVICRELLCLFTQALGSLLLTILETPPCSAHQLCVFPVEFSLDTFDVLRDENGFDKRVELAQQDITEDGTNNRALWHATERLIELPILKISCIKQFSHKVEKPSIMDVLTEQFDEQVVGK
jgi:hypothetical protein